MQCYLCGSARPTTVDHVPPKGFFPTPRPSNLITVPCCQECNSSYSKDDEAIRAWFSMWLNASKAAEWIIQNKVLPGIISRSPPFRESFLSKMEDFRFLTVEDGEIDAVRYAMDAARIERFLIRVVRGLLTHYCPDYNASKDFFKVHLVKTTLQNLETLDQIKGQLHYDSRGEEVLQYRFGLTQSKQSGIWIMLFYGAALFLVLHTKEPKIFEDWHPPQ
jgi:hypothetical protein